MSRRSELETRFSKLGGVFLTPIGEIQRAAERSRLVADWDGVFNGGAKGEGAASTFSEPDSMGIESPALRAVAPQAARCRSLR